MEIHPDDILTFQEVTTAMRRVAKQYDLPLRNITGYPMPKSGMANRMGDCAYTGDIRLVLRCTENGQWCEDPINPSLVWDVAAHELAHLRHMNHGPEFQDFCEELQVAMNNQKVDHRQKVIDRIIKFQNSRESEAAIGNAEAAQAFAGMINKMLIEYELNPSEIDYARASDRDPVIELWWSRKDGAGESVSKKTRVAWQESLARTVANANLCKILIVPGTNNIVFVGTKSHATVAEYVFGTMVPAVEKLSKNAEVKYWHETGCGRGKDNKALGYRAAWIDAFITRIFERFDEAKKAAFAQHVATGNSEETGLMRLNGALRKVQSYIDDKFSNRRAASRAGALNHRSRNHEAGRAAGREAANSITLGRRGLNQGSGRGRLGE